jgi:hypothetical protein
MKEQTLCDVKGRQRIFNVQECEREVLSFKISNAMGTSFVWTDGDACDGGASLVVVAVLLFFA